VGVIWRLYNAVRLIVTGGLYMS